MSDVVRTMLKNAYFRGQILPSENAKISLAAHSLQYGTACFSGIRGYFFDGEARLFRVKDHFERLMNAAKILGMNCKMEFAEFEKALIELTKINQPQTGFYFRPFIFSEDEILTPKFDGINFEMAIYMISLGDYLDTTRGLRLMVSSWQKFSDAAISTKAKACGAYLNAALARSEANRCGYDEAIVMDDRWNMVEGSAENLFIIYRGEAIFPEIGSSLLEGITMRTVLDLLQEENVPVRFGKIDRSMIYTCDELLLTGTGAQIVFAESIDDRIIGYGKSPGPICTKLRKKFDDLIAMNHHKSGDWVTCFKI